MKSMDWVRYTPPGPRRGRGVSALGDASIPLTYPTFFLKWDPTSDGTLIHPWREYRHPRVWGPFLWRGPYFLGAGEVTGGLFWVGG